MIALKGSWPRGGVSVHDLGKGGNVAERAE